MKKTETQKETTMRPRPHGWLAAERDKNPDQKLLRAIEGDIGSEQRVADEQERVEE